MTSQLIHRSLHTLSSLTRPGRLEEHIAMQLPDAEQVTSTQLNSIASHRIAWLDSRLTFNIYCLIAYSARQCSRTSGTSCSERLNNISPTMSWNLDLDWNLISSSSYRGPRGSWTQIPDSGRCLSWGKSKSHPSIVVLPVPVILLECWNNDGHRNPITETLKWFHFMNQASNSRLRTNVDNSFSPIRSPGELKNFVAERGLALIRDHAMWPGLTWLQIVSDRMLCHYEWLNVKVLTSSDDISHHDDICPSNASHPRISWGCKNKKVTRCFCTESVMSTGPIQHLKLVVRDVFHYIFTRSMNPVRYKSLKEEVSAGCHRNKFVW